MKEIVRNILHKAGLDIRRWDDMSVFSRQLIHILKYLDIDLVYDVGAHWGEYAEMLWRTGYKKRIISIEPLSEAHKILDRKAHYKISRPWVVFEKPTAFGNFNGEIEINIAGGNNSSSSILPMNQAHLDVAPHTAYVGKEKVQICRLDDYVKSDMLARNIFLKIDTQGYEMKVLEGSTGILDRIKGVQVEMSTVELYEGQALDYEISEWLINRGFQLWTLNPFLYDPKSGKLLQYDAIFIKGWEK